MASRANRSLDDECQSGATFTSMSPEAILAARSELRMTQQRAADLFGVGRRTWLRWERGEIQMPRSAAVVLSCLKVPEVRATIEEMAR